MRISSLLFILSISITLMSMGGLYDITFTDAKTSKKINLSDYKGNLIMVVNTASLCGFTKQYNAMQEIWEKYKDRGFILIAVPTNDFGNQEPGADDEIVNFCKVNFGINFPITTKVSSKGDKQDPFFKLARKDFGYFSGPFWNFYKYLYSPEGKPIKWYSSFTKPDSSSLEKIIEKNLPKR